MDSQLTLGKPGKVAAPRYWLVEAPPLTNLERIKDKDLTRRNSFERDRCIFGYNWPHQSQQELAQRIRREDRIAVITFRPRFSLKVKHLGIVLGVIPSSAGMVMVVQWAAVDLERIVTDTPKHLCGNSGLIGPYESTQFIQSVFCL